jgi:hypothetical protein
VRVRPAILECWKEASQYIIQKRLEDYPLEIKDKATKEGIEEGEKETKEKFNSDYVQKAVENILNKYKF